MLCITLHVIFPSPYLTYPRQCLFNMDIRKAVTLTAKLVVNVLLLLLRGYLSDIQPYDTIISGIL
jgi:hypothetical protein